MNPILQHLKALRVAKKLGRGALAKEVEKYLLKELVARVDVTEEELEKENNSDSDGEAGTRASTSQYTYSRHLDR